MFFNAFFIRYTQAHTAVSWCIRVLCEGSTTTHSQVLLFQTPALFPVRYLKIVFPLWVCTQVHTLAATSDALSLSHGNEQACCDEAHDHQQWQ